MIRFRQNTVVGNLSFAVLILACVLYGHVILYTVRKRSGRFRGDTNCKVYFLIKIYFAKPLIYFAKYGKIISRNVLSTITEDSHGISYYK